MGANSGHRCPSCKKMRKRHEYHENIDNLLFKGSFVRKFPSYRRTSRGSLGIMSSSGQHHHVKNMVNKSSSSVGAVEKSNSLGTREATGENTLRRKTLLFRVKWFPWSLKEGLRFLRFLGSIWQSCRQKAHRTVERDLDLHLKMLKKCHVRNTFGR